MEDLIKALNIFLKYGNEHNPTYCQHDTLYICGIDKKDVSKEDHKELEKLGFCWDNSEECYYSYRFGS